MENAAAPWTVPAMELVIPSLEKKGLEGKTLLTCFFFWITGKFYARVVHWDPALHNDDVRVASRVQPGGYRMGKGERIVRPVVLLEV